MLPMPNWLASAFREKIDMLDQTQKPDQFDPSANQPSTLQWILIIVFGLVALCGIMLFLSGGAYTIFSYYSQQDAQAAATEAAATAIVDERLLAFQSAANWPLLLFDPFDDNQNGWIDGPIDDDYATIDVAIDGSFSWNVTDAKQGFVWRDWPKMDDFGDFYLAVDVQNFSSNADAQYGLIFHNRGDDYFYFEVRDLQYFRFFSYEANQWKELLPYTFSAAVRPGEVNHLAVLSQGNQYTLWINDEFVGEISISYPVQGQAGVIIGLAEAGEEALIVFDNFEVRVPEILK